MIATLTSEPLAPDVWLIVCDCEHAESTAVLVLPPGDTTVTLAEVESILLAARLDADACVCTEALALQRAAEDRRN